MSLLSSLTWLFLKIDILLSIYVVTTPLVTLDRRGLSKCTCFFNKENIVAILVGDRGSAILEAIQIAAKSPRINQFKKFKGARNS